jgi:hypothetical protein
MSFSLFDDAIVCRWNVARVHAARQLSFLTDTPARFRRFEYATDQPSALGKL